MTKETMQSTNTALTIPGVSELSIAVKTEVLQAKADAIRSKIAILDNELDGLKNTMNATKAYWKGDAAEAHREVFKSQYEEMTSSIKKVREYSGALDLIAFGYIKTEMQVKENVPQNKPVI